MLIQLSRSNQELQEFLEHLGWIANEKILSIAKAGEGNMNVVLRVTTEGRSFVLKQSRPYVQKYPDIPAPEERIDVEAQFYQTLEQSQVKGHLPRILHYNKYHHLLMMEDLGAVEDLTSIYNVKSISDDTLKTLLEIAFQIHSASVSNSFPLNLELRQLNYQHIFHLPFLANNGFSLDEVQHGLQKVAASYQQDLQLSNAIKKIGESYLSSGNHLIHGDYYPGSWMTVDGQLFVLDPEFAHLGNREFDIGVMGAHIVMATMDASYLDKIIKNYPDSLIDKNVYQFAGIEIMRRLLGLAQLPLDRSLEEKSQLLQISKDWIL